MHLVKRFTTRDLLTHNNTVCNPSILMNRGIMIYRDGRKEDTDDNTKLLKICKIDKNLNASDCQTIHIPGKDLSDARLIEWKNNPYIVATIITLRPGQDYLANMDILDIQNKTLLGLTYDKAGEKEKNWIFFEYQNQLFCSHSLWDGQHKILKLNGTKMEDYLISTYETKWPMYFGGPRNTSNFAVYDGLMWGCFHSHDYPNRPTTYYCGLFAFEPNPPFRIVRMSNTPLFHFRYKGDIFYPNHLDIENNTFRIGMGVAALDHFDIISLSKDEIKDHLQNNKTFHYVD
jgi:hypothetical protein